jgi:hypothetical protein
MARFLGGNEHAEVPGSDWDLLGPQWKTEEWDLGDGSIIDLILHKISERHLYHPGNPEAVGRQSPLGYRLTVSWLILET